MVYESLTSWITHIPQLRGCEGIRTLECVHGERPLLLSNLSLNVASFGRKLGTRSWKNVAMSIKKAKLGTKIIFLFGN